MFRKSISALAIATTLLASTTADAALNAYLKLKGQKSGEVKGSVMQKGRENTILVIATDQTTSKPGGGKTMPGPFVITKEIDKSSPILHSMLSTGEPITEFTLQFFKPQLAGGLGGGMEVLAYTVKLTNARISNIRTVMHNNKNADLMKYEVQEEVSFTYDKIEWTWVPDGNITASEP